MNILQLATMAGCYSPFLKALPVIGILMDIERAKGHWRKVRSAMPRSSKFSNAIAVAAVLGAGTVKTFGNEIDDARRARGANVILELNKGRPQSTLESLRADFPFLADAIESYALGDVWSRSQLDSRSRQIAAVSAFAALGHIAFMKIHASYALNVGVSEDELKEIVHLTTVHAGFPRAIEAAKALGELFAERRKGNEASDLPR